MQASQHLSRRTASGVCASSGAISITTALETWGHRMQNATFVLCTENEVLVAVVHKLSPKEKIVTLLARQLVAAALKNNVLCQAQHVPVKQNETADALSPTDHLTEWRPPSHQERGEGTSLKERKWGRSILVTYRNEVNSLPLIKFYSSTDMYVNINKHKLVMKRFSSDGIVQSDGRESN